MRKLYIHLFTLFFSFILFTKPANACSPLNVPTLLSFTVTSTNLLIDWKSTTVYTGCPDAIDVEIKCSTSPFFGGLAAYTYTSATVTASATPYVYPTQTITISSFCPGTVYQFRARERNNPGTASSAWTTIYSFTTQGTYSAPSYSLFAYGNPISDCLGDSAYMNFNVYGTCNSSAASYTWAPAAGLSCINCPNPSAQPSVTTVYTVSAAGNQLSCWAVSNKTVQVTVLMCSGIETISNKAASFKVMPNPVSDRLRFASEKDLPVGAEVEIFNSSAETVMKTTLQKEIDVSQLSSGYYILKITAAGNKVQYSRFVKE